LRPGKEEEEEGEKKWRCLVDNGQTNVEMRRKELPGRSSMSGNYPKSCWVIITLRSEQQTETLKLAGFFFSFRQRETAQGRR